MSKNTLNSAKLFLNLPIGAIFQVKIKSDSMAPLFLTGDSVWVERTQFTRIETGDIICFYRDFDKNLIIHRVVKKFDKKNKLSIKLVTMGDNSSVADFGQVSKKDFVGLAVSKSKINHEISYFDKRLFIIWQRLLFRLQLLNNFFN